MSIEDWISDEQIKMLITEARKLADKPLAEIDDLDILGVYLLSNAAEFLLAERDRNTVKATMLSDSNINVAKLEAKVAELEKENYNLKLCPLCHRPFTDGQVHINCADFGQINTGLYGGAQ